MAEFSFIFGNDNRKKIIEFLRKSPEISISQIQEKMKIDYKTVWQHLEVLQSLGVIKITEEKNKKGKPKKITLNENKLEELRGKESKEMQSHLSQDSVTFLDKKIMTIIEELGGTADFDKILEWANKNRYRDMAKDSAMVSIFANLSESSLEWAIPALVKKGLIELKITEKGKKSIKLNGDFK